MDDPRNIHVLFGDSIKNEMLLDWQDAKLDIPFYSVRANFGKLPDPLDSEFDQVSVSFCLFDSPPLNRVLVDIVEILAGFRR